MADRAGLLSSTPTRPIDAAALWMLAGLLVLIGTIVFDMTNVYWLGGTNGQGPIVLIAAGIAYWRRRALFDWQSSGSDRAIGATLSAIGLIAEAIGHGVAFLQLEGLALMLIAAGATLLWGGAKAWQAMWPINLLLLAAIPMPGSLADALLVPMKALVSGAVVALLSHLHYPVALNGVIISIGFYQLQVADACSGLWSLVSLISVGLIYEFFVGSSRRRVALLFILLIPFIAILTNFLRVLALVLTVGTFGSDAEAQLHDAAAYLELVLSLIFFAGAHAGLERAIGAPKAAR